jgi:Helix-turn-helix of DDE superfamily endonuclease
VSYEQVKNLEPTEFKRLCGVTPATFEQMVKVVAAEKVLAKKRMRARRVSRRFSDPNRAEVSSARFGSRQRTKQSGRPSKLSIEDQVLMTLEYWREYRTHFHIGVSWGLSESNVFRNIRKVENILIKSGLFNVEGKKKFQELDSEAKVLVVDVAEHEVERPKKTEETLNIPAWWLILV